MTHTNNPTEQQATPNSEEELCDTRDDILNELRELRQKMQSIRIAVLKASTIVLPYDYYSDEQKSIAGIVKVEKQDEHPIDSFTGERVETYGYEETHSRDIDEYTANIKETRKKYE